MFGLHKCSVEKIKDKNVYHNEEVENLYQKVYLASKYLDNMQKESVLLSHSKDFTLKIDKNPFHLFLIPVIIHNKTYRFVVDTGAQISGIMNVHKELIETYKKEGSMGIKSASGSQKELPLIQLDRFFVGSLEVLNHTMVVLNEEDFKLPLVKKSFVQFDGILGWDILSKIDFELDDKNSCFSMIQCEDKFTYCNLLPTSFPVLIAYDHENKPVLAGIDSGAEIGWISEEYCEKRNLKIANKKKGLNVGVHGIESMAVNMIKECEFSFCESKIILNNIRTGETKVFKNLALDAILGNEIFHNKRIQFLNSKGIVRILDSFVL